MGKLSGSLVKKRRRLRIYLEQGGKCYLCQAVIPIETATLDHVYPRGRGGSNLLENLMVACLTCNQKKGSRLLSELKREG